MFVLSLAQALPQALSWGDSCTRGWQEPGRATAVVVEPGTHGERVGGAGGHVGSGRAPGGARGPHKGEKGE